MTGEPLLALDRVSRHFGGLRAVDEVSLEVARHGIVGLIGPNGAGKTTLFNLVAGATAPSGGAIRFAGADVTGRSAPDMAAAGIGRTFQNLRTLADATVFDIVSTGVLGRRAGLFSAALRADRQAAREADEAAWLAIERCGLSDLAGRLALGLAYGQRKYVEIARALAGRPDLVLLDEPAAGLNDSETSRLGEFIARLRADGTTILLVEHHMGLVLRACDRVAVLVSGRKIADGTPAEVAADALVVESYLGGTPA